MRKTASKPETHIVMRVDRETGTVDLRVFSANLRLQKTKTVGAATLRIRDLREIVSMLTQQLEFEDLLGKEKAVSRGSKKAKSKTVRASMTPPYHCVRTSEQYIEDLDRAGLIDLIKREIAPGR